MSGCIKRYFHVISLFSFANYRRYSEHGALQSGLLFRMSKKTFALTQYNVTSQKKENKTALEHRGFFIISMLHDTFSWAHSK